MQSQTTNEMDDSNENGSFMDDFFSNSSYDTETNTAEVYSLYLLQSENKSIELSMNGIELKSDKTILLAESADPVVLSLYVDIVDLLNQNSLQNLDGRNKFFVKTEKRSI